MNHKIEVINQKLERIFNEEIPRASMGYSAIVYNHGEVIYESSYGKIPELNFDYSSSTIYDLASLTKPLVTSLLILKLLESGKITLKDTTEDLEIFPGLQNLKKFTIENLLTHTSGLIPDKPLYLDGIDRKSYLLSIEKEAINAVPGTKEWYSDLNYILLGFIIEEIEGNKLDKVWEMEVSSVLNLNNSFFNPTIDKKAIAPSEVSKDRGLLWGKVNDEKAFYIGGVAGHAGLFSNAEDILKITKSILNGEIISRNTLEIATKNRNKNLGGMFGLGWMTKSDPPFNKSPSFDLSGFMGDYAPIGTFGHTGFTGTSICMNKEMELICILLTNRTYPSRENNLNIRLRRKFHNAIFSSL